MFSRENTTIVSDAKKKYSYISVWSLNIAVFFFFMDNLIVLLKVLDLLHDLFENFGAVLWRIAVFTRQILISSFNWLRTFWLFSQSANEDLVSIISLTFYARALHLSLMTAPSTSLSVPYSKSYWSRRARRIKIKKGNFLFNYSHYYLI